MIKSLHSSAGSVNILVKDSNEQMQRNKWMKGIFYEYAMLEYIYRTYKGGIYIDCGSNIGNHTLFFAAFCADLVYSIEPVYSSWEHQAENLALNDLYGNVFLVNYALSDEVGRGSMEHFGENVGQYKLVDGDDTRVVTLDYLHDIDSIKGKIKLIKIDVEYSELKVLKGAAKLLATYKPVLFVELGSKKEQDDVTKYLRQFGYIRKRQFNATPTLEYVHE